MLRSPRLPDDIGLERPPRRPWAYFLTAACYGARFHGHPEGSVDRNHSAWRWPRLDPRPALADYERSVAKEAPFRMDESRRRVVLDAIRQHCEHDGWVLHAAHVRTNHLHVVVTTEIEPERVLGRLKAYASRALNERFGRRNRYWARHGSTIWLWDRRQVNDAVEYVVARQGRPMAVYENPERWAEYLVMPEG